VSRESARPIVEAIREAIRAAEDSDEGETMVVVDFEGIAGIAPSFMDELLSAFDLNGRSRGAFSGSVIVANPPTRLSLKFEAIARAREMSISLRPDGSWLLVGKRSETDAAGSASTRGNRDA
jgi:hypothetical protein